MKRTMRRTAGLLAVWCLSGLPAAAEGPDFEGVVERASEQVRGLRATPTPAVEAAPVPGPAARPPAGGHSVEAVNSGKHLALDYLIRTDHHRSQQVLARYLQEGFGCTAVTLCMTEYTSAKPGLFKDVQGTFTFRLTASCAREVPGFRFDVSLGNDMEDYTDILIGHESADGSWIETGILARRSTRDTRLAADIIQVKGCDSSPVDPTLPYAFITSRGMRRTFPK